VTRERIRQIQNVALRKLRKKIEKLEAVTVAA
jgi:DNA-directed RNA polymerase sigma subunit (sigma70/sigma32)